MQCVATGNFLSDDGKILNTTNRQNIYQFDFAATMGCGVEQNANESIFLNITQLAEASEADAMNATAMDFLGKVVLYNTRDGDFVMQGNWDVNIKFKNQTAPIKIPQQA